MIEGRAILLGLRGRGGGAGQSPSQLVHRDLGVVRILVVGIVWGRTRREDPGGGHESRENGMQLLGQFFEGPVASGRR